MPFQTGSKIQSVDIAYHRFHPHYLLLNYKDGDPYEIFRNITHSDRAKLHYIRSTSNIHY